MPREKVEPVKTIVEETETQEIITIKINPSSKLISRFMRINT